MEKKFKFKIYFLFYLIPIAATAYLFWQNTKPVLELDCDFKKKTALCGELVPTARVAAGSPPAGGGVLIKEDPVYFDARIPRKYDRVEAKIEYSGLEHDLLEFGVSRDESRKAFDFVPLQNKILDNLPWQKIEGEGLVLYQRKSVYKNISELKKKMPATGETLVYRADAAPPLGVLNAKGKTVIDFPVKESLRLLVYKKGGEPKVRADGDDFKINIYPAGDNLYKVEIIGNKNTVFTNIAIDSPYAAILDKIKFGALAASRTVYFYGSRILARAEAASGTQKIDVNGKIIDIDETYQQYSTILSGIKLRPIKIQRGEAELGGALFFVNNKNVFYPRYEPFYPGADLSKINFIITGYKAPEGIAEKTARVSFDIKNTPAPGGKLRFIISLPNAAKSELVKIKSIKLKFSGEKFTISDIWHKMFNKLFSLF